MEGYICIKNIRIVSLISCLKVEGIVKWRGLKSQGTLYSGAAYIGQPLRLQSLVVWRLDQVSHFRM